MPCCDCPDLCSPWLEDGKGLVILGKCHTIKFGTWGQNVWDTPLLGFLPSPTASWDP